MAKAGEIHVRTMDLLAGKIRAGVTTGELDADRISGAFHDDADSALFVNNSFSDAVITKRDFDGGGFDSDFQISAD